MSGRPDLGPPPIGGDENGANRIHIFAWTLALTSIIFVTGRMYSRIKLTRNTWWDDYLICASLFLTVAISSMWSIYGNRGYARHMYYLTPPQVVGALKLNTVSRSLCVPSIALGKISVAFLIERIAPRGNWRKWLLRSISISIAVTGFITFVLFYAQCRPVAAVWDKSLVAKGLGNCWDPHAVNTWNMVISSYWAFLDFALAFIPVDMVWKLQMKTRKKIALCFLLGLGVFASICASVKVSKVPITVKGKRDLTWQTIELLMWGATEMNVIIIAASIPTLRPLYLIIFKRPGAENYGAKSHKPTSYARAIEYSNLSAKHKSINAGSRGSGAKLVSSMGGKKAMDDNGPILLQDDVFMESRELKSKDRESQEELHWGQRGDAVLMTDMIMPADGEKRYGPKGRGQGHEKV